MAEKLAQEAFLVAIRPVALPKKPVPPESQGPPPKPVHVYSQKDVEALPLDTRAVEASGVDDAVITALTRLRELNMFGGQETNPSFVEHLPAALTRLEVCADCDDAICRAVRARHAANARLDGGHDRGPGRGNATRRTRRAPQRLHHHGLHQTIEAGVAKAHEDRQQPLSCQIAEPLSS
ncbi:MAG: hypothetical protein ACI91B_000079 [Planctomycetota bacterium]|jgi:hypothetical protein